MGIGLTAAAIGLTLVLRPRADFCARCAIRLIPNGLRLTRSGSARAAAALRAGDPAEALRAAGEASPDGKWVTVWYCPECRDTIVWGSGAERVVATGGEAIVAVVASRR
jgi:hypothetical protein